MKADISAPHDISILSPRVGRDVRGKIIDPDKIQISILSPRVGRDS